VKWPNAGEGEHQYGFSIFNSEPISGNYTCIIPVPAELNLSYIYHHQVMVMGDLKINPDHMELASGKLGESHKDTIPGLHLHYGDTIELTRSEVH
jgi:hypothetical protein